MTANMTANTFNFVQPVTLKSPHADKIVADLSTAELAQVLAERLSITPDEWHRLKANRKARAAEQGAIALSYLLNNQSPEALERFQQAVGWLDKSISAPPCPTHGK
jgi:Family of unknown function (DUF6439)